MKHTREITTSKNAQEGMANYMQMIINNIEAGNKEYALELAVSLRNNIEADYYQIALTEVAYWKYTSK